MIWLFLVGLCYQVVFFLKNLIDQSKVNDMVLVLALFLKRGVELLLWIGQRDIILLLV